MGVSLREHLERKPSLTVKEPLQMKKQKMALDAGALISGAMNWDSIVWNFVRRAVRRLQMRIAKAIY